MIEQMRERKLVLERELRAVNAYIDVVGGGGGRKFKNKLPAHPNKGRTMSAATRKILSIKAKARWAKIHKAAK